MRFMAWLWTEVGRRRSWLFFVIGGIGTGLVSAGFAWLADRAEHFFRGINSGNPHLIWLLAPAGFALSVFLVRRVFPNSQGSGVPQCIAAMRTESDEQRNALISFRAAIGKVLLTLAGLCCGASVGREGPSIQVGASLLWGLRGANHSEYRALILAGSAAGLAAAFNAPLAGIVFAIEEMSRSFDVRSIRWVLLATVLAGVAATAVTGEYTYFGQTSGVLQGWKDWGSLVILGVTGGVLGACFSRFVIAMSFNASLRAWTGIQRSPVLFAAGCGLVIALCGTLSGGMSYGTGYHAAYDIIHDGSPAAWAFVPLKFIATAVSSVSGIPGGLFAPSLSIGAGLGSIASEILPISAGSGTQFALLGMVAYLTGVVQSPITSVLIMMEMTGNNEMALPLLACALLANAVSRYFCPSGIYHALAENFLEKKAP
jgi:H+/Cl- antiporter ClcA